MKIGILWDLDGTLLDTLVDLQDGVNHALAQFGLPPRTLEEIRAFVEEVVREENSCLSVIEPISKEEEA